MPVDRRKIIVGIAATVFASVVCSPSALAKASEQTQIIHSTSIPVTQGSAPWDFDLFYDLSRYITARSDLDPKVARTLFAEFRKEEWGWSIAAKLYANLRRALDNGFASGPEFLASGQLSELEQWFAEHILDAWYEGIYRYDGSEIRVVFEDALMWEAVEGIVPVQGLSDAEYGHWGKRPNLADFE